MTATNASSYARFRRNAAIGAAARAALPPQFLCRREHQHRDAETCDRCDARPERCAVCGGLNPGDVKHARCI